MMAANLNVGKKRSPAVKTYTPLTDKMVVGVIQSPDELESGLLLPESAKKGFITLRAKVLAIGPDVKQVKVGDVVLLPSGAYEPVIHRGHVTLVVAEIQVWGVEDEDGVAS